MGSGQKTLDARCGDKEILHLLEIRTRQHFIAVPRRGRLCLFDASARRISEVDRVEGETVALSPDESMIASASLTGEIVLLSAATLSEITRFKGHRGAVHAVHFTVDSKHLLSGGADETLRVWPAGEAHRIATLSIGDLRRAYASDEPVGRSLAFLQRLRFLGLVENEGVPGSR